MPFSFWLRRFLLIFAGAFILLAVVYWLRGQAVKESAVQAGIWSFVAAAVFIATRLYHSSRGRRCELCRDMPEESSTAATGNSFKK